MKKTVVVKANTKPVSNATYIECIAQIIDLDGSDSGANSSLVRRRVVPPAKMACNQVIHQSIPPAQLNSSINSTRSNNVVAMSLPVDR